MDDGAGVDGGSSADFFAVTSQPDATVIREILDGTTNTVMLLESAGRHFLYRAGRKEADSGTKAGNSVLISGWAEGNVFVARGYDRAGLAKGPCMINCSNGYAVNAFHPGGANVAMADGSVRFLKETISPATFAALMTRAAGEVPADY